MAVGPDEAGDAEDTLALPVGTGSPWRPAPGGGYDPPPGPPVRYEPAAVAGPSSGPPPGQWPPTQWPPGDGRPPLGHGYPPPPVFAHPVPVVAVPQKDMGIAYVLWFFFGVLGVHHLYLGNIVRGLLYLFTLGFLGLGVLLDLFLIPSMTRRRNAEAFARYAAMYGPSPTGFPALRR